MNDDEFIEFNEEPILWDYSGLQHPIAVWKEEFTRLIAAQKRDLRMEHNRA